MTTDPDYLFTSSISSFETSLRDAALKFWKK